MKIIEMKPETPSTARQAKRMPVRGKKLSGGLSEINRINNISDAYKHDNRDEAKPGHDRPVHHINQW